MTYEEKATMVSVDDKYSKGSVEVARGKRMTLLPSNSKKDQRRKTIVKEVKRRQTKLAMRRASNQLQALDFGDSNRARDSRGARNSCISFASGLVIIKGSSAEF